MQVPLALVDRIDNLPFVDRINGDNVKGGRMAADVLIAAGRRQLVAVEQKAMGYSGKARIAAFIERAAEDDLATSIITVEASEYEGGAAAAVEVLAKLDQHPGVFCPSDTVALGLLDALRNKHDVRIPEELSLIGYDDIPQASWAFANLTTIKQSVDEFAKVTVELLNERIRNPEAKPKNEIIDVTLVRRGTV